MTLELPPVEQFTSSSGARIFRIPCEVFRDFMAFVHLVLDAGPPTLVDVGSGIGHSNEQILEGLATVRDTFHVPIGVADIERILLTHGHVDHFGGLSFFHEQTGAEVLIHQLDRRVLTAYEERVIVATKALRVYLQRAGVAADLQWQLMEMYGFSKKHVHSVAVDQTLRDGQQLDGMRVIHTPGHCPGQVCLALGDVLLSADHVLERTTPHQAPESITPYTGLGHYLESLDKVAATGGFDLALGGHEGPIHDVYKRLADIRQSHVRKLERTLDIVREAAGDPTIQEITQVMYSRVKGFHVLLALEEVGAHVEYLYQTGDLAVSNLDEVERDENPALRYQVV